MVAVAAAARVGGGDAPRGGGDGDGGDHQHDDVVEHVYGAGADGGAHDPVLPHGVALPLLRSNPSRLLAWALQIALYHVLRSKIVVPNEEVVEVEVVAAFLGRMQEEGGHHTVLRQVRKATAVGVLVHPMGILGWIVGIQVAGAEVACARLGPHGMLEHPWKARRTLDP